MSMASSFAERPVGVLLRLDYGGRGGSGAPPGRGDSVLGGGEQGMKQVERRVSAEETEAISM